MARMRVSPRPRGALLLAGRRHGPHANRGEPMGECHVGVRASPPVGQISFSFAVTTPTTIAIPGRIGFSLS
ncbi:formin-like protein 5 isoform X1 [Iris pallida]|uniref:Formin-like protein 5 isoform X1 n=1 Tax=Iris pallida TaxID=29817 RepID=A0AAX6GSA9_IRIPA|nr:formin-like protein 5 isoform X1 [Iris pallida]KAJ6831454.1 formin-like protein 5 isoform X1 [Iris pallida]